MCGARDHLFTQRKLVQGAVSQLPEFLAGFSGWNGQVRQKEHRQNNAYTCFSVDAGQEGWAVDGKGAGVD
ncbi:hypothetical protein DRW42_00460 [Pedobacter miscanthi]|uniref:Uncharacterized protein n=1 Tax=Pedobacter miscanthi TaxID=2259170 RepID=A0A366LE69_9SPHI|nr:hypothetical protein DRW42_00460 [Pedobacter miscanthi]